MTDLTLWLGVGVGGAFGALVRAACVQLTDAASTDGAGTGLLGQRRGIRLANTLGCFALGWLSQKTGPEMAEWLRVALAVGVCGSLTTFSTLCAQLVQTLRSPKGLASAALELGLSLGLGFSALYLGMAVG